MKYAIGLLLLMLLFYLLSFAGYNWKNKNRIAAVGSAILCFTAVGLAFFVLFFGKYEV